jgi:hypothetical protein
MWRAGGEHRNDSAGKKGGHRSGPPFFMQLDNRQEFDMAVPPGRTRRPYRITFGRSLTAAPR